jgi:integrase
VTAKSRDRRLEANEGAVLNSALADTSAWYPRPLIAPLSKPGCAGRELLSIRRQDVDLTAPTVRILKTKNGHPRTIPLTPRRLRYWLHEIERTNGLSGDTQRCAAGLEDLRLHDLRQEVVSRFFVASPLPKLPSSVATETQEC